MHWNVIMFVLLSASCTTVASTERQSPGRYSWAQGRMIPRGGDSPSSSAKKGYGRISPFEYRLTPEQIEAFHRDGCVTLPNVLDPTTEVDPLVEVFDRFTSGEIPVPGKDFCDMSQPFGVPYEQWRLVNCMLPTKYHPPLQNNVYERITQNIAQQLFPKQQMTKDYDQFLNKRPGQPNAVFHWHQDMAYWPGPKVLNVESTSTCTFSLALDDSDEENGCLRYVAGSGRTKTVRPHHPATGTGREDGHALTTTVDVDVEPVTLAPSPKGSMTIHDEYVVHGSGGNHSTDRQRRTYVVAYRAKEIVDAERRIGFTHSHNDHVNWDTFEEKDTASSK